VGAGAAQGGEDFQPFVGGKTTFRVLDSSLELLGWHETKEEVRVSPVATKEHFFGHFQVRIQGPTCDLWLVTRGL